MMSFMYIDVDVFSIHHKIIHLQNMILASIYSISVILMILLYFCHSSWFPIIHNLVENGIVVELGLRNSFKSRIYFLLKLIV